MSYKEITKASYQATAKEFADKVTELAPLHSIERFIQLISPKAKILDIGCGSGRDAKIFTDRGMDVLGIDFSSNLIEIAKKTAPLAKFQVMDIEEMKFPVGFFDGAWAASSLLHIPKSNILAVFNQIHSLLKEKGYFYLTIKKGTGEILENDTRYGEFEKFWSFYEEKELQELLQNAKFKIVDFATIEKWHAYQTHPSFRVFCQKE